MHRSSNSLCLILFFVCFLPLHLSVDFKGVFYCMLPRKPSYNTLHATDGKIFFWGTDQTKEKDLKIMISTRSLYAKAQSWQGIPPTVKKKPYPSLSMCTQLIVLFSPFLNMNGQQITSYLRKSFKNKRQRPK